MDSDSSCALAKDDQFSNWWLYFQICRSRKLKVHSYSEVETHFTSTKELNGWLSDAVGAKQLLGVNRGRKLHWWNLCFHENQDRHEQLEPFREQLRQNRHLLIVYHLFHKCDENFRQLKFHHSSGVVFVKGTRISRLSTQFSLQCLVITQESIGKNSSVAISEHLLIVEMKCKGRIFLPRFFHRLLHNVTARNLWSKFPEWGSWIFLHKIFHIFHHFFSSFWIHFCSILFLD